MTPLQAIEIKAMFPAREVQPLGTREFAEPFRESR